VSGAVVTRVCPQGHEVHAPASMITVRCPKCGATFAVEKPSPKVDKR
jgi:uncharacterized C2H2 Zn-finger protein